MPPDLSWSVSTHVDNQNYTIADHIGIYGFLIFQITIGYDKPPFKSFFYIHTFHTFFKIGLFHEFKVIIFLVYTRCTN